jgi:hypothetical protein
MPVPPAARAPAVEERVTAGDERAGLQWRDGENRSLNLALAASLQDMELHPLRTRRCLCVSNDVLGCRIVGVSQAAITPSPRSQFGQQLGALLKKIQAVSAIDPLAAGWEIIEPVSRVPIEFQTYALLSRSLTSVWRRGNWVSLSSSVFHRTLS